MIYELYLPKLTNTGKVIPFQDLTEELLEISSFTVGDGFTGYWKGKDRIYAEPVWVVRMVAEGSISDQIERFLFRFKSLYDQEATFYSYHEGTGVLM